MIKIKYAGRFGNLVFQSWAAHVFASRHDILLENSWPMRAWVEYRGLVRRNGFAPYSYSACETITDDNFERWMQKREMDAPRMGYTFQGYFQRMDILHPHIDILRHMFYWRQVDPRPDGHIAMHVRLTDHGQNGRLHLDPNWYAGILEKESFDQLTICTDDPWAHEYFDVFKKWNPAIRFSPNAMSDFNALREHRRIIIGPSSFAVIAALTGHAAKIYQWKRDQELPHIKYQIPSTPECEVVPVDGKFLRETRA